MTPNPRPAKYHSATWYTSTASPILCKKCGKNAAPPSKTNRAKHRAKNRPWRTTSIILCFSPAPKRLATRGIAAIKMPLSPVCIGIQIFPPMAAPAKSTSPACPDILASKKFIPIIAICVQIMGSMTLSSRRSLSR